MATPVSLAPPPALAHASVVGTSFVNQYYMCLQSSPRLLYRFYMDHSHLTLAPSRDATSVTVNTHDEINRQISGLHYDHCKAVIASVDSQYTSGHGVLVQVTGTIASATHPQQPRPFVQSFVLAPQEKGYYVLNDIIRYTDAAPHPPPNAAPSPAAAPPPAALAQAAALPPPAMAAPQPAAAAAALPPSTLPPAQAAAPAAAAPHMQQRQQPAPSAAPASAAPAPAQPPSVALPPAPTAAAAPAGVPAAAAAAPSREVAAPVDDASAGGNGDSDDAETDAAGGKPLTYADMTKKKNALQAKAVAAAAATAAASAASGAGAGARAPAAAVAGAAATPSGDGNVHGAAPVAASSNGGALGGGRERLAGVPAPGGGGPKYDYCSVFVRNVPASYDEAKVREALSVYGRVKELSLKPQKGAHDGQKIAFIDFDTPEAASAAIQATIVLADHTLAVELKKITPPGTRLGPNRDGSGSGPGRGAPGPGRGLGPRSGPPRGSGPPSHNGVNGDGPGDAGQGDRGRAGPGRGYGAPPGGGVGRGGGRGDGASTGIGRGPGAQRPAGPPSGAAAAAAGAAAAAPPAPRATSATPAPRSGGAKA